jgi:hypothetical protein
MPAYKHFNINHLCFIIKRCFYRFRTFRTHYKFGQMGLLGQYFVRHIQN